ncbi:hypothetical protein HCN44_005226 [Aphidius gifuensis]|uniref:Zincin n=1 Tax=Aphidius gifuensis TaxID=684658 RepID=A0A835CR39_APHGI|nr:hypothetical protein HCN44_005226 [Aphidius gifuensis]
MERSMNLSVKPCDNFYDFVCGNYMTGYKKTPTSKTIIYTRVADVAHKFHEKLIELIEEPIKPNEIKPIQSVKNYYKICMDDDEEIDDRTFPYFKNYLVPILGRGYNWPISSYELNNNFDWKKVKLQIGNNEEWYNIFFDIKTEIDTDKKIFFIYINEPSLGLSVDNLADETLSSTKLSYFAYMRKCLECFSSNLQKKVQEIYYVKNFEIKIAKIIKETKRNSTKLNNPMTIDELIVNYSFFPWKEYFNDYLKINNTINNYKIKIIINNPTFMIKFEQLINITSKKIQINYFAWRKIISSAKYLNFCFRNAHNNFNIAINNLFIEKEKSSICFDNTLNNFPILVGALYTRSNDHIKNAKENITLMVKNIKNQLKIEINKATWMTYESKKIADNKITATVEKILYPNELLNDTLLNDYYKYLQLFNDTTFIEAVLSTNLFNYKNLWNTKNINNKNEDWTHFASLTPTTNAYFNQRKNYIIIPAGLAQGFFYGNDHPSYSNYAGIGMSISHEISHGFDNQTRQYAKEKNHFNFWINELIDNTYLDKINCILDQYNNYTNSNTIEHINENIADNIAIKIAHKAYKEWKEINKDVGQNLGGKWWSPDQMFWISTASRWCSSLSSNNSEKKMIHTYHSDEKYRAIVPFSNMKSFAADFDCQINTTMNPEEKCRIW